MNHLKLKGLDNGTLYRQVAVNYDLCFTRDAGFVHNVRQMRDPGIVEEKRKVELKEQYVGKLGLKALNPKNIWIIPGTNGGCPEKA